MTGAGTRVASGWLALREPADAAARSRELAGRLLRHLPPSGPGVIHDLACGTGSMGRWLAPLLPGPQRWVLHDHDADLLRPAAADPPAPAADGAPVAVEVRQTDITRVTAGDLAGAGLITASALLDLMTGAQLGRLLEVCRSAECPLLLTLSVSGQVGLDPADPLDDRVAAAFNGHQRRVIAAGRLLGPDAVEAAASELARWGDAEVLIQPSPWRLGEAEAELAAEWVRGWTAAACEQDAGLVAEVGSYRLRRMAEARERRLRVTVGHSDLLVLR